MHQTERNQLSYSEFKVISMVASINDLIDPDSGEDIARKRWKLGIDGGNAAADAITFCQIIRRCVCVWNRLLVHCWKLPRCFLFHKAKLCRNSFKAVSFKDLECSLTSVFVRRLFFVLQWQAMSGRFDFHVWRVSTAIGNTTLRHVKQKVKKLTTATE